MDLIQVKRIYLASENGWGYEDFHKFCDNKGPILIVMKAKDRIFGGFSSLGWDSTSGYIKD